MSGTVPHMGEDPDVEKLKEDLQVDKPRDYEVEHIADLFDVSYYTVRKWLREKKLRGYKRGKKWYVLRQDLIDFANSMYGPTHEDAFNR